MNEVFRKLALKVSNVTGKPAIFLLALLVIAVWALSGPVFGFSDTWQLFINTGTTVATFLMVFLIQNTQNRDSKALHIKLDELLRKKKGTSSDKYVNVEELKEFDAELMTFFNINQRKDFESAKRLYSFFQDGSASPAI